tara:strand:+ start:3229 stop:4245 length:1017 start_codon:yes stop_codon:yes gene_type:complete
MYNILRNIYYKFYTLGNISKVVRFININLQIFYYQTYFKKLLKSKKKTYTYCYDLSKNSIGYGDFYSAVFFLRVLCKYNTINFYFFTNKIRKDTKHRYTLKEIRNRLQELAELLNFLCANKICIKQIYSQKQIEKIKDNKNVIFKELIINDRPIYQISNQLLNKNFNFINKKFFYLDMKVKKIIKGRYITLGIRLNYKNEIDRNINHKELILMVKYIRQIYKNDRIVVISKNKNKKILNVFKKLDKNFLFAMPKYAKNYVDCGKIILNSKHYFQYKGTGLFQFAEFSKIKFNVFYNIPELIPWRSPIRSDFYFYDKKKGLKNIWQLKKQKIFFINSQL